MRTFKEYKKIYETGKYQKIKNKVDEYLDAEIENQLSQGTKTVIIPLGNIATHINIDNKIQILHIIDDVLDHTDIPYYIMNASVVMDDSVIIEIENDNDENELTHLNKTHEETKLEPWKQIVQQFDSSIKN